MGLVALRAGQHGVVVGQDGAARDVGGEHLAVDPPDARDQTVGGRARDEVVQAAPARLRGERQRAVLDEAARVTEIVEVLPGGTPPCRVPLAHGSRSPLVPSAALALEHLGKVGTCGGRPLGGHGRNLSSGPGGPAAPRVPPGGQDSAACDREGCGQQPGREALMGIGRLVVRTVVGGLFIGHGTQKLFGWFGGPGMKGTEEMMDGIELEPPRQHATVAGVTETVGGSMLVIGLGTPVAAAGLIGMMTTAIRKVHLPNGVWNTNGGYEYNLVLIASAAPPGRGRPRRAVARPCLRVSQPGDAARACGARRRCRRVHGRCGDRAAAPPGDRRGRRLGCGTTARDAGQGAGVGLGARRRRRIPTRLPACPRRSTQIGLAP